MTDVVQEYFENSLKSTQGDICISSDALATTMCSDDAQIKADESTYTMARDQSQMSRDVDLWMRGPETAQPGQASRMIVNAVELLASRITSACQKLRGNIRRLAQNHMSRDILATTMDVILVIYAIGFLVLSMYEASIIG